MKRIIAVSLVMSLLLMIAGLGINYSKNRVELHTETLNRAKEYAKSGDYTLAQREMAILNNQFKKTKKIMSLYISENAVEQAQKEIKYTKTLADMSDESFISQATICEYYIYQLYEVEKLRLKTWF